MTATFDPTSVRNDFSVGVSVVPFVTLRATRAVIVFVSVGVNPERPTFSYFDATSALAASRVAACFADATDPVEEADPAFGA